MSIRILREGMLQVSHGMYRKLSQIWLHVYLGSPRQGFQVYCRAKLCQGAQGKRAAGRCGGRHVLRDLWDV